MAARAKNDIQIQFKVSLLFIFENCHHVRMLDIVFQICYKMKCEAHFNNHSVNSDICYAADTRKDNEVFISDDNGHCFQNGLLMLMLQRF